MLVRSVRATRRLGIEGDALGKSVRVARTADQLVLGELLKSAAERVDGAFQLLDLGAIRLSAPLVALVVALFAETLAASAKVAS